VKNFGSVVCLLLGVSVCAAGVIQIPGHYPTIQDGITHAAPGDTIVLADSLYSGPGNQDISFLGKRVHLLSAKGAAATAIDGLGTNRLFSFTSTDADRVVIEGITIRNGYASFAGGAILSYGASPTFRDCTFSANRGHHGGAAFLSDSSQPRFIDCRFTGNRAGDVGASVFCRFNANAYFENCVFDSNIAVNGAFLCFYASPTVVNCRFSSNYAGNSGGAVFLQDNCSPLFTNCLFERNTTNGSGGVVYIDERCKCGGNSRPILAQCTFVDNYGPNGAVLFIDQHSTCEAGPSFVNCILAYNRGGPTVSTRGGQPRFAASNIYGNPDGDWPDDIAAQAGINGNFSADPRFCDTVSGIWLLRADSPCAPSGKTGHIPIGAFGVGCDPSR